MPHRLSHCLDTTVVAVMASVSAATPLLFEEQGANNNEMRLLLLPLIGAMFMSGGMILLNPSPETRRIVIGRCFVALFFGVFTPQILGMIHPALSEMSLKPVVLILLGGVISSVAYVLSKPFTRELYERAEGVAKRQADALEQKYAPRQREMQPVAMQSKEGE